MGRLISPQGLPRVLFVASLVFLAIAVVQFRQADPRAGALSLVTAVVALGVGLRFAFLFRRRGAEDDVNQRRGEGPGVSSYRLDRKTYRRLRGRHFVMIAGAFALMAAYSFLRAEPVGGIFCCVLCVLSLVWAVRMVKLLKRMQRDGRLDPSWPAF